MPNISNPAYQNPYGLWHVETDCEEGMSSHELGIFEGFIDDIALSIPPAKVGYSGLTFKAVSINKVPEGGKTATRNSVPIQLAAESGTWNLGKDERAAMMQELFDGRPVVVTPGGTAFGVTITRKEPEPPEVIEERLTAERALGKLTDAERDALCKLFKTHAANGTYR